MTLPKDLEAYRNKKVIARIGTYIFLTVFFALLLIFHGNVLFPLPKRLFYIKICVYIFVMILPMLITGVPSKLFDSTWQGEIVDVKIKGDIRSEMPLWFYLFHENDIIVTVKKDDGELIKIKALSIASHVIAPLWASTVKPKNYGKIEHHLKDYEIGDRVAHFYGLKPLFVIKPNKAERSKYCLACGTRNDTREASCFHCKHTLLEFEQFDKQ